MKRLYHQVAFANALMVAGLPQEAGINGASSVTTDPVKGTYVYRDGDTVYLESRGHKVEIPWGANIRYMTPMNDEQTETVKRAGRGQASNHTS